MSLPTLDPHALLNPRRPRLEDARAVYLHHLDDCAACGGTGEGVQYQSPCAACGGAGHVCRDEQELWEALVGGAGMLPVSWAVEATRWFPRDCSACCGLGYLGAQPRLPGGPMFFFCEGCSGVGWRSERHWPATVGAQLAFASDPEGVQVAEQLGHELVKRLGCGRPERRARILRWKSTDVAAAQRRLAVWADPDRHQVPARAGTAQLVSRFAGQPFHATRVFASLATYALLDIGSPAPAVEALYAIARSDERSVLDAGIALLNTGYVPVRVSQREGDLVLLAPEVAL